MPQHGAIPKYGLGPGFKEVGQKDYKIKNEKYHIEKNQLDI